MHSAHPLPSDPSPRDELRTMIDNSLLDDWIIRVEYATCGGQSGSCWQQWGKALFALASPEPALLAINACRAAHPGSSVPLNCQKVRPVTRMVYWVHRAEEGSKLEDQPLPGTAPLPDIAPVTSAMPTQAQARRGMAWRAFAALGVVLGSLLMVEMAIN